MSGGARPRQKGSDAERAFAQAIGGQRVPLSGAAKGYPGDVKALGLVWEVKQRRNGVGWRQISEWLKGKDALALHQPYKGWLVVLSLETLLNLLPEDALKEGDVPHAT